MIFYKKETILIVKEKKMIKILKILLIYQQTEKIIMNMKIIMFQQMIILL
jgi:hypothetical protein